MLIGAFRIGSVRTSSWVVILVPARLHLRSLPQRTTAWTKDTRFRDLDNKIGRFFFKVGIRRRRPSEASPRHRKVSFKRQSRAVKNSLNADLTHGCMIGQKDENIASNDTACSHLIQARAWKAEDHMTAAEQQTRCNDNKACRLP